MKKSSLYYLHLLIAINLSSCSTLASREAAAGCQVADVASTEYAVHHNPNAYETNTAVPFNALMIFKLLFAGFIMWYKEWDEIPEGARAFVTVLGCYPVPGNISIGRKK